jgi:hypothetical protein
MKFSLAIIFLVLATGAMATPSPYPGPRLAPGNDDTAIYLGPSGAMLEADYFNMPRPRSGPTRIFPCQMHLRAERAQQIVQSCD